MKKIFHGQARKTCGWAFLAILILTASRLRADTLLSEKTTPVMVTFGVHSLSPATMVDSQTSFVSQDVSLPEVVCAACDNARTHWKSEWLTSDVNALSDVSQSSLGWYVFASGLDGIGIGIRTKNGVQAQRVETGRGNHASVGGELSVGLVRLAQNTEAGLSALPPGLFRRLTRFYDETGHVLYAREDTVQVSADLRVPTCTSTSGALRFDMPEISQVWLKRNVAPGEYTESFSSLPQLIVANCSENTRSLRLRFIAGGAMTESSEGPSTILVGMSDGRETGTGYLVKYIAEGFGEQRKGVVQWDRVSPLALTNPHPEGDGNAMTRGITVTLQAFYARPKNNLPVSAGETVAKGIYQVSYE